MLMSTSKDLNKNKRKLTLNPESVGGNQESKDKQTKIEKNHNEIKEKTIK